MSYGNNVRYPNQYPGVHSSARPPPPPPRQPYPQPQPSVPYNISYNHAQHLRPSFPPRANWREGRPPLPPYQGSNHNANAGNYYNQIPYSSQEYPPGGHSHVPPLMPPPLPPPGLVEYTSFDNFPAPPPPPVQPPLFPPSPQKQHVPYSTSYPTTYQQIPPPSLDDQYQWARSSTEVQERAEREKRARYDSELAFVPVVVNPDQLNKMAQAVQEETEPDEVGKPRVIKLMEANGFVDPRLPMELKQLFEPLYCKLCTLTLSSTVVARDHYVGKKHTKRIEQWLQDNKITLNGPSGANAVPVGSREVISGTVQKAADGNGKVQLRRTQIMQSKPQHTTKRYFDRTSAGNSHEPLNKKPKGAGGPNFAFCDTCQISLTSQAHADQHYNGKNHAAKLKQFKNWEHWGDRTFGIGRGFHKPKPGTSTM